MSAPEPVVLLLPEDLLAELTREAERRGLDAGILAEQLLATELPVLLGEQLRDVWVIDVDAIDDLELPQSANDAEAAHLGVVSDHPQGKGRSGDQSS